MIMSSRREDAEGEARARATRDGDVAGEGVVRLARRRERGGGERGGGERGEVRRGRAGAVRVPVVPCVPAHAGWGLRGSRRLFIREVGDATLVVSFSFWFASDGAGEGMLGVSFFFSFRFFLAEGVFRHGVHHARASPKKIAVGGDRSFGVNSHAAASHGKKHGEARGRLVVEVERRLASGAEGEKREVGLLAFACARVRSDEAHRAEDRGPLRLRVPGRGHVRPEARRREQRPSLALGAEQVEREPARRRHGVGLGHPQRRGRPAFPRRRHRRDWAESNDSEECEERR